jgi:tetratricopeptide (TPR) repeat protein
MSPAMLDVIAEELSDIEAEASNLPRFHQVLGDLYMKQGRYQEAIDEYNKIG